MKSFNCDACGGLIFFENNQCISCNHALGFLPELLDLSALEVAKDGSIQALAPSAGNRRYRHCANSREPAGCNWMIPTEDLESFCAACRLNEVIPDLSVPENPERWQRLEQACGQIRARRRRTKPGSG